MAYPLIRPDHALYRKVISNPHKGGRRENRSIQESPSTWLHVRRSRRDALQAGAIRLLDSA